MFRETGNLEPRTKNNRRPPKTREQELTVIAQLKEEQPEINSSQIAAHLGEHHGVSVHRSTISGHLVKMGYTYSQTRNRVKTQRTRDIKQNTEKHLNPPSIASLTQAISPMRSGKFWVQSSERC